MTANQTIDGVPREWIEEYEALADLTSGDAQKLRALLDAAESAPCAKSQVEGKRESFQKWVMATNHPVFGFLDGRSLARSDDRTGYADEYVQGLWVAYLAFGAAQPQGEPVAWHTEDNLTDKSSTTYDLATMERWKAKGWPVTPLYAEQPAPVAVVLAEAREWLGDGKNSDGLSREHWTPEYAALIDRIDATLRK